MEQSVPQIASVDGASVDGIMVKITLTDCSSPWAPGVFDMPAFGSPAPGVFDMPAFDMPTSSRSSSLTSSSSRCSSSLASSSGEQADFPAPLQRLMGQQVVGDVPFRLGYAGHQRPRARQVVGAVPFRLGDAGHDEGKCKPCKFTMTQVGCKSGDACEFCHRPHDAGHPKAPRRRCNAKRHRYNRLLGRIMSQAEQEGDGFDFSNLVLPPSIEANSQLKDRLEQRVLECSNRVQSQRPDQQKSPSAEKSRETVLNAFQKAADQQESPSADDFDVITDVNAEASYGLVYRL